MTVDPATLFRTVAPYTLIGDRQLATLHDLSRNVAGAGICGDIVECGVANGGSAAVIAQPHVAHATRRLFLYDTFQGIPPAGPEDGHLAQSHAGEWKGTQDKVREALGLVDFPEQRVMWRAGQFADTFANESLPARVALLHADCDFYAGVLLTLQVFYPRVSDGGYVVLDDFGWWPGCRKAFYQWCRETGETPLVERTGKYGLYWKKGRASNVPNRDMS